MSRSSFLRLITVFFILAMSLFFSSKTFADESQIFGPYCMPTLPENICDDFHFNADCSVNTAPAQTQVYSGNQCCIERGYSNCRQISKTKQGATGGNACVYLGTFQCYTPTPTPTPTPIPGRTGERQQCNSTGTAWVPVSNVCVAPVQN